MDSDLNLTRILSTGSIYNEIVIRRPVKRFLKNRRMSFLNKIIVYKIEKNLHKIQ